MTNYIKVDYSNSRIIMDRTFARNAEIAGSPEYNQLQQVRKDYPSFTVVRRQIKKNATQERYRGLTYAYMEEYIISHESKETVMAVLDELSEMRLIAACHSKPFRYPTIKKWFLDRYPEIVQFGMNTASDSEVKVIEMNKDNSANRIAELKKDA